MRSFCCMKSTGVFLLTVSGWLGGNAVAQSTLGSITGVVKDPSGASILGATLTLTNVDENTKGTALSSSEGLFEFPNLKPGRYTVSADHEGFTRVTTPEILLDARQTREADLTLALASSIQNVVVTAQVPLVDTEDGTISDSKGFDEIDRLPLNYRATFMSSNSPFQAILTTPGMQQTGGRFSLAGGLPGQINVSLDGISVTSVLYGDQDPSMTPSPEILQEFRVSSVDNSAEFGQMGEIAMVSRGGGNQIHGSAFWYLQNAALDATYYGSSSKQAKVYNTFGGSFSGPLTVPHLYHGRNRTFFFVDYEGARQPQSQLNQETVPTAAMRSGDVSGLNLANGGIVDPLTGLPFPNNQIPATRFSSVAENLINGYFPLPNTVNNGNGINYRDLTHVGAQQDGYDIRVDHHIGPKQWLYARWTWKSITEEYDNWPLPVVPVDLGYKNLVISHTFTPRADLSNELRIGFTRTTDVEHFPIQGTTAVASLGLMGLNLSNVAGSGGFPVFYSGDGSFPYISGGGRPENDVSRNYQATDALTWIRGRHTLKFGAEIRRVGNQRTLHSAGGDDFGEFDFTGAFSGNSFTDLLLGLPFDTDYDALGPNLDESATDAAFFAQDRWKVTNSLTIQAGLRWEVHPPFEEAHGNIANFDTQNGAVIIPDNSLPPSPGFLAAINACSVTAVPGCTQVLTASQAGLPNGLRHTYYGDWDPRLGFAWQPSSDGKTVIRGGIGGYTESLLGWFAYGPTGVATSDVRQYQNNLQQNGSFLYQFPNATPPLFPVSGLSPEEFETGVNPNFKDPRTWQWNFTIERELPWKTVFQASYIGTQSAGLPVLVDYNQVPVSTQPYSQARAPFPNFALIDALDPIGFSNYQGMQVELSHRFLRGIFFQASYVLSKDIGEAGSVGTVNFPLEYSQKPVEDRFNTRLDRGILPGTRRNRFLLTGVFALPFGQGRAVGSTWHGVRQGVLGGWELSTVTLIQSGQYATPWLPGSDDQSNTDEAGRGVGARPDRIGNGNLPSAENGKIWDSSAFPLVPKGAGRFGNAGVGILEGPGTVAISAGLAKNTRLTEKLHCRIEASFTNLPNHPNFSAPVANLAAPTFGYLTSTLGDDNAGNRTGQLALRFDF